MGYVQIKRCKLAAGPFKPEQKRCDWCGKALRGRRRRWCSDPCSRAWWNNHVYRSARKCAKRRDHYKCVLCGSKYKLEVNHIKPCLGKHAKKGCWHHIDNLQTLCHDCHVEVTRQQRLEGKLNGKKRHKPSS